MIAAEKLLRIALFSDELPMQTEATLTDRRKKLAESLRAFRKKERFQSLCLPYGSSSLWQYQLSRLLESRARTRPLIIWHSDYC